MQRLSDIIKALSLENNLILINEKGKTTTGDQGKGYELRALLQALTYGRRAPILGLQRNSQQSLDTADLGGSGYMSEPKMMPSLQHGWEACGSKYFLKSLHWLNLSLS